MNNEDEQRISRAMMMAAIADAGDLDITQEKTLLEDGITIRHHRIDQCEGNCCLHGTSIYQQCKQPRTWRSLRRHIEHHCPCDIGHPCGCYIDYSGDPGVHGCCGIEGHCPTIYLDPTRIEGVEERKPELESGPEPVDPLTSLRLVVSAHDYLIGNMKAREIQVARTQRILANRVALHAERIQRLERRLAVVTFLGGLALLNVAVALWMAVPR